MTLHSRISPLSISSSCLKLRPTRVATEASCPAAHADHEKTAVASVQREETQLHLTFSAHSKLKTRLTKWCSLRWKISLVRGCYQEVTPSVLSWTSGAWQSRIKSLKMYQNHPRNNRLSRALSSSHTSRRSSSSSLKAYLKMGRGTVFHQLTGA